MCLYASYESLSKEEVCKAHSQHCEEGLLTSSRLYVLPTVRVEHLGSYWTDFHEILHLSILRESVEKIQGSLKSDKTNGHLT